MRRLTLGGAGERPKSVARLVVTGAFLALLALPWLGSRPSDAALPVPAGPAPAGPSQGDPADVLEACLRQAVTAGAPGASAAVLMDGRIIAQSAAGLKRQDDPNAAVDAQTLFRIGSSTKTFTAVGLLRLVDRGLVDLDAPLSRYLPDLRYATPGVQDQVTLRHLLSHTSGLPDNSATQESDLYQKPDPTALRRWVLGQAGTRAHAPPGRFYNYSSANYMIVGHVIERVSGLSYQDYMRREVFEAAGLTATTLVPAEVEAGGNYAFGHWRDSFHGGLLRIWKPSDQDNWARHPTGYIHSSPSEVVRFLDALMRDDGGLLSPASLALMQSGLVDTRELAAGRHYGLGVLTERYGNLTLKHHNGSAWGWLSTMRWVPERRFAVSVLTNGFVTPDSSADCAMNAFLRPTFVKGPDCPIQARRWPGWTGRYEGHSYVGEPWAFDVRQGPSGALEASRILAGGPQAPAPLRQSCADAGAFQFDSDGNGSPDLPLTFIDDPEEPGVVWLRHRQIVLRRAASGAAPSLTPVAPTASPSPPDPTPPPPTAGPTATVAATALFLPWARPGR